MSYSKFQFDKGHELGSLKIFETSIAAAFETKVLKGGGGINSVAGHPVPLFQVPSMVISSVTSLPPTLFQPIYERAS